MHRSSLITAELGALECDLEVKRDADLEKAKAAVKASAIGNSAFAPRCG
jgi:hypothetical protein